LTIKSFDHQNIDSRHSAINICSGFGRHIQIFVGTVGGTANDARELVNVLARGKFSLVFHAQFVWHKDDCASCHEPTLGSSHRL